MRQKLTQESPYLVQEWMTEKNDRTIDGITGGSNYKAWWKCKTCDHQWKAMVKEAMERVVLNVLEGTGPFYWKSHLTSQKSG